MPEQWRTDVRDVLVEFIESPEYWRLVGARYEFTVEEDPGVKSFEADGVSIVDRRGASEYGYVAVRRGKGSIMVGFGGYQEHGLDVWLVTPSNRVRGIDRIRREREVDVRA